MSLPLYLPNGIVAVYGTGVSSSPSGMGNINPDGNLRWGYISQVYDGGAVFVYNGDTVMFKEEDVVDRVLYLDYPYTLVPVRLVTKEQYLP